jgi:20S proteasome alpha/beta subunit
MTLIIGLQAKDGIVLGSDRKIMRGGEAEYANKIHILDDVAFAIEGLTGVADDFLLLLRHEISLKKGFGSLYEAKIVVEDIIAELTRRYSERVGESSTVGVLMAGLEGVTDGPAKLYYIHSEGYGEAVNFRCSGSGGRYAVTLAKFLHDENESVEENAKRLAYVIQWISEKVDSHVGGEPLVAMIRNGKKGIDWLEKESIEEQKKKVEIAHQSLWKVLSSCTPVA